MISEHDFFNKGYNVIKSYKIYNYVEKNNLIEDIKSIVLNNEYILINNDKYNKIKIISVKNNIIKYQIIDEILIRKIKLEEYSLDHLSNPEIIDIDETKIFDSFDVWNLGEKITDSKDINKDKSSFKKKDDKKFFKFTNIYLEPWYDPDNYEIEFNDNIKLYKDNEKYQITENNNIFTNINSFLNLKQGGKKRKTSKKPTSKKQRKTRNHKNNRNKK